MAAKKESSGRHMAGIAVGAILFFAGLATMIIIRMAFPEKDELYSKGETLFI